MVLLSRNDRNIERAFARVFVARTYPSLLMPRDDVIVLFCHVPR